MGIGLLEIVVIAVAALVILGPERLPSVLQQVGRIYVQLRRTSSEFRNAFDDVVRKAEYEARLEEVKRLASLVEATKQSMAADPSQLMNQVLDKVAEAPDSPQPNPPPPLGRHAGAMDAWQETPAESSNRAEIVDNPTSEIKASESTEPSSKH